MRKSLWISVIFVSIVFWGLSDNLVYGAPPKAEKPAKSVPEKKKESAKQPEVQKPKETTKTEEKRKNEFWINIFPIGIDINSFAIDQQNPTMMYAIVDAGRSLQRELFKSVDGGKLWTYLNNFDLRQGAEYGVGHKEGEYGTEEVKNASIKVDPVDSKTLYVGLSAGLNEGYRGSLLKSKDGGIYWEDISGGVISGVYDFAINPKNPEIIYVISGNTLYKTLNGGKTWGEIAKGAHSVFLNPEQPDEVYASIEYIKSGRFGFDDKTLIGIYQSSDGGQSFKLIKPPVYNEEEKRECTQIYGMLNSYNSHELFVRCYENWTSKYDIYLFKSSDYGKSWANITVKEEKDKIIDALAVAFSPQNKEVIYAVGRWSRKDDEYKKYKERDESFSTGLDKVLKSTDGGKTWTTLPFVDSYLDITNITISSSNVIYVTTDHGIWKSVDDGANWEAASFGLPVKEMRGKLLVNTGDDVIYVSQEGNYWTSNDKGASWQWHSSGGKHWSGYFLEQKFTSSDKSVWEFFTHADGGKFQKTLPEQQPVEIKTPQPSSYFAVSSDSKIVYILTDKHQIFKSEDSGFSWAPISGGDIASFTVNPQSPDIVYAITTNGGLLKTTDSGKTWAGIEYDSMRASMQSLWASSKWLNPKERPDIVNRLVSSPSSVILDPSNSNIVYAVTSVGVYRSDDGGKSWKLKSPMDYLKALVNTFDNYSAQQCKDKGVRKDCKVTLQNSPLMKKWQVGFFINIPPNYVVVNPQQIIKIAGVSFNNISINPSDTKNLYLATGNGVYRSFDRGDTWQALDRGLLEPSVKKVIVSSSIILAEGENGIYKLSEQE